jgi:superfamily II RNA helicase
MAPGVFEGSLVRAVRRLEELLRQLGEALKARRTLLVGFMFFCA